MEYKNQHILGRAIFGILILICLALLLSGCGTTYLTKPLPPISCGSDLKPEVFEPCDNPKVLPLGSTFEQGLKDSGNEARALRSCSLKAKLLQDTIKECQKSLAKLKEEIRP